MKSCLFLPGVIFVVFGLGESLRAQPGRGKPALPNPSPERQAEFSEFIKDLFDKNTRPRRLVELERASALQGKIEESARPSPENLAPIPAGKAPLSPKPQQGPPRTVPAELEALNSQRTSSAASRSHSSIEISPAPSLNLPSGYPVVERFQVSSSTLPAEAKKPLEEGVRAFSEGRIGDALALFEQAREAAPEHPVVLSNLGAAQFRSGDEESAIRSLTEAVARDLNSAAAWQLLGIMRFQVGDIGGAHAALAQADYLQPDDPRTNNYLGLVMTQLGLLDAAEEFLTRAARSDPTNAETQFNLAVIYLRREPQAIELARRHYRRALALGAEPDANIEQMLQSP